MASKWIVAPDTKRLEIELTAPDGTVEGHWMEVKKSLNVGEARKVQTAGWKGVSAPTRDRQATNEVNIAIDFKEQSLARTMAYVVRWSLDVPVSQQGIESLREDVYEVIENALTAHVEEQAAEKKVKTGNE